MRVAPTTWIICVSAAFVVERNVRVHHLTTPTPLATELKEEVLAPAPRALATDPKEELLAPEALRMLSLVPINIESVAEWQGETWAAIFAVWLLLFAVECVVVWQAWTYFSSRSLYEKAPIDWSAYINTTAQSAAVDASGDLATGILSCFDAPTDVLHWFFFCTPMTLMDVLAPLGMIEKSDAKWYCIVTLCGGVGQWSVFGVFVWIMMPWILSNARARLGGSPDLIFWDILRGWLFPMLAICQLHRAVDAELRVSTGCLWDVTFVGAPVAVREADV